MNNSKNSVRTLTMLALLVAMSIVFSRVLSISTGFVRFNLGSLPVLLAALLFGPGAGFAVGAACGAADERQIKSEKGESCLAEGGSPFGF